MYVCVQGDEHHRFPDSAYSSSELDVSMDAVLRDPVLSTSRAETAGVLSAAGTIKGAQVKYAGHCSSNGHFRMSPFCSCSFLIPPEFSVYIPQV